MNSLKYRINKELIRGSKIEKPKRPSLDYYLLELDCFIKTQKLFQENKIVFKNKLENAEWRSN